MKLFLNCDGGNVMSMEYLWISTNYIYCLWIENPYIED